MAVPEERDVIARVQEGDLDAFRPLYESYYSRIYSFCRGMVYDREVAVDIAQETFYKALKSIRSYDPRKGAFASWLLATACNLCRTHRSSRPVRSTSGQEIEALADRLGTEHDFLKRAKLSEFSEVVRRILLELPPRERAVLSLWLDGEATMAEVAKAIGISLRSAERSCAQALAHVRRRLREIGIASEEDVL
jgi:RNA polymerase sigma-70 factor (ECF subfamily)